MSKLIKKKVEEIINKNITNEYNLVDIEYIKEGSDNYLRIYFDKDGGLKLEDCESLSKIIGEELDRQDFIKDSYYLEISSPGLDRPIKTEKDFNREKGKKVDIKLYKKIKGLKEIVGVLLGLDDDNNVLIEYEGETILFSKKDIAKINLHVDI